MGEFIVELAWVRTDSAQQENDVPLESERPVLRAVPDLAPARPELPQRRPSRRAIVRAKVWGVPLPAMDDEIDPASADQRIAEAVRLLGAL